MREPAKIAPPTDDKRWRIVEATMRRNGFRQDALIETLHSIQEVFGFLDTDSLVYAAKSLSVSPSKVYGVATFYHYFQLKPQGEHICAICLGTACYIKGAKALMQSVHDHYDISEGQTTPDNRLSLLTVRCLGACSLAPAAILDGEVVGYLSPTSLEERLDERMAKSNGKS